MFLGKRNLQIAICINTGHSMAFLGNGGLAHFVASEAQIVFVMWKRHLHTSLSFVVAIIISIFYHRFKP